MTPTPPTIDTVLIAFSTFSSIILGVFGILLVVIGGLGGFLVWNGFELRKRAEKDLEKIEETKDQAVKMFVELQAISENWRKFADENMKNANESVKQLAAIVSNANLEAKAIRETKNVVKAWEGRYAGYSTASQGTAQLFSSVLPFPSMKPDEEPKTAYDLAKMISLNTPPEKKSP